MARVHPLLLIAALAYTTAAAALAPLVAPGPIVQHPPQMPAPPPERPTNEARSILPTAEPTAAPRVLPGPEAPLWPAPALPRGSFDFAAALHSQCSVLLSRVPALAQGHNLSCEAAAIRMVLAGRWISASEEEILARMGFDENPHKGFRGNPDGALHDPELADYGAYAEVVARVLASFGVPARIVYGMSNNELRATIADGQPVIVWMTRQPEPRAIEANGYRLVDGEHVLVVVGLTNDGRFVAHDPWGARPDSGRTGTFITPEIQNWDLFDRMAVVVPLEGSGGGPWD